jgi:hypothetical protein
MGQALALFDETLATISDFCRRIETVRDRSRSFFLTSRDADTMLTDLNSRLVYLVAACTAWLDNADGKVQSLKAGLHRMCLAFLSLWFYGFVFFLSLWFLFHEDSFSFVLGSMSRRLGVETLCGRWRSAS